MEPPKLSNFNCEKRNISCIITERCAQHTVRGFEFDLKKLKHLYQCQTSVVLYEMTPWELCLCPRFLHCLDTRCKQSNVRTGNKYAQVLVFCCFLQWKICARSVSAVSCHWQKRNQSRNLLRRSNSSLSPERSLNTLNWNIHMRIGSCVFHGRVHMSNVRFTCWILKRIEVK